MRRRRDWAAVGLVAVVAVVSVLARSQVPVYVIANAEYDDALFVRGAQSLLSTGWLGSYDKLTLAKGPGFPLFLAATHLAGVPLQVALQLVQLLAAAALGWGAARFARSWPLGLLAFVVTALDPAYLSNEAARVNRTGLYASLSTALLGLLLVCGSPPGQIGRRRAWAASVGAGAVAGCVGWACLVTREERLSLLPVVVASLLAAVIRAVGPHPRAAWRAREQVALRLAPVVAALLAAGLIAGLGFAAVQARNDHAYRLAAVTDFVDGHYPELYAALADVQVGPGRQYVPISRDQRAAAYAASPTFAQLRPLLEGHVGKLWTGPGCYEVHVCDDLAGGWVPWALRQSVFLALKAPDAVTVQAFYGRAASEIRAGCGARYVCRRSPVPFLPDLSGVPVGGVLDAVGRGAQVLSTFDVPTEAPPAGAPANQAAFARLLRGVSADPLVQQARSMHPAYAGWRDGMRAGYRVLLIAGAAFAVLGLFWPRDHGQRAAQALGLVVVVAAVSRVGLLALADVTSFPAVTTGYLLPAFDPAVVGVVVGCWCLGQVLASRRRAERATAARGTPGPNSLAPPENSGSRWPSEAPAADRHGMTSGIRIYPSLIPGGASSSADAHAQP